MWPTADADGNILLRLQACGAEQVKTDKLLLGWDKEQWDEQGCDSIVREHWPGSSRILFRSSSSRTRSALAWSSVILTWLLGGRPRRIP